MTGQRTRQDSEILKQLIVLGFDTDTATPEITLGECLDLYARLREREAIQQQKVNAALLALNRPYAAVTAPSLDMIHNAAPPILDGMRNAMQMAEDAAIRRAVAPPAPPVEEAPPEEPAPGKSPAAEDGGEKKMAAAETATDHPVLGFAPAKIFTGRGSEEKRAVFERLKAYRETHGLGCLQKLADATNGALDDARIRDMLDGAKAELSAWKLLNAALEYVENKERKK